MHRWMECLSDSRGTHRPSSFTPDGTALLFSEIQQPDDSGSGGNADVAMISLAAERPVTRLVQTSFVERNAEVSPDGRWMAYETNESGEFQVYVRPFPAVEEGRWQVSTDGGRQPVWTRNGRELVYVAPDGAIMVVPVEVGRNVTFAAQAPARVGTGEGFYHAWNDVNQGRTYDVSADGNRFLRFKEERSPDATPPSIVVVQNWTEELKRLVPTN
jgi:eukaryotic-like serine/threonine-protein kinase